MAGLPITVAGSVQSGHVLFRVVGLTFQYGYPDNVHRIRDAVNRRRAADEPMPVVNDDHPDRPGVSIELRKVH